MKILCTLRVCPIYDVYYGEIFIGMKHTKGKIKTNILLLLHKLKDTCTPLIVLRLKYSTDFLECQKI